MILVIDGPEKAGKSTLISAVIRGANAVGIATSVVHHGKECASNDGSVYFSSFMRDWRYITNTNALVIWDRAWPSEWVYGHLMGRVNSPIKDNSSLIEDSLGLLIRQYGYGTILLGPGPDELATLRTEDDHPVNPHEEWSMYMTYAKSNNWTIYSNQHTDKFAFGLAEHLFRQVVNNFNKSKEYEKWESQLIIRKP